MNHSPELPPTRLARLLLSGLLALIALLVLSVSLPTVDAQRGTGIIRVAPWGSDADKNCGSVDLPCQSIGYALSRAESGDLILVAQGTYNRPTIGCYDYGYTQAVICINRKNLTILGGYDGLDWTQADWQRYPTIIEGTNVHRGLLIENAALHMEGFIFQNCLSKGELSGELAQVSAYGGALLAINASLTLRNLIFRDNRAEGGGNDLPIGGRAVGAALSMNNYLATPTFNTLENILFEDNVAQGGNGQNLGGVAVGGALYVYNVVLNATHLTFTHNLAQAGFTTGAGREWIDALRYYIFADAQGGAAAFYNNSVANLFNVTVTDNRAIGGSAPNGDGGGAFGGGLYLEHGQGKFVDMLLRDNVAQGGDGLNPFAASTIAEGGGLQSDDSNVALDRVHVINNVARGGNGGVNLGPAGGGGLAFTHFDPVFGNVIINNTIIADNRAELGITGTLSGGGGGGLWIQGMSGIVSHTTIAGNSVSDGLFAPGVIVIGPYSPTMPESHVTFDYTLFANHAGGIDHIGNGRALHVQPGGWVTLTRGLWSENQYPDTNINVSYRGSISGLETMYDGPANFVAPGAPAHDYHIFGASAARGRAWDSGQLIDIDGEPRTIVSPPDIGADEYDPIILVTAPTGDGRLTASWRTDQLLAPNVHHYVAAIDVAPDAAPPLEGTLIDTGLKQWLVLTGLTNGQPYTVTIQAVDEGNSVLDTSNMGSSVPWPFTVILPALSR